MPGIHFESKRLGYSGLPRDQLPKLAEVLTIRRAGPVIISLGALIGLLVRGYSPALAAFWATITLIVFFIAGARSLPGLRERPG